MASSCERKKNALKDAVDSLLYDTEKEMYFEGLNTPSPKEYIGQFMPQNIDKRYYLKHSNILSVYSGLCDGEMAKMLIEDGLVKVNDEVCLQRGKKLYPGDKLFFGNSLFVVKKDDEDQ